MFDFLPHLPSIIVADQFIKEVEVVWSITRLNSHLQIATGIRICNDWLRRLVHAEGFVYRRPKHTLKGKRNEKAFRKAQKALNRLKKGL